MVTTQEDKPYTRTLLISKVTGAHRRRVRRVLFHKGRWLRSCMKNASVSCLSLSTVALSLYVCVLQCLLAEIEIQLRRFSCLSALHFPAAAERLWIAVSGCSSSSHRIYSNCGDKMFFRLEITVRSSLSIFSRLLFSWQKYGVMGDSLFQ